LQFVAIDTSLAV